MCQIHNGSSTTSTHAHLCMFPPQSCHQFHECAEKEAESSEGFVLQIGEEMLTVRLGLRVRARTAIVQGMWSYADTAGDMMDGCLPIVPSSEHTSSPMEILQAIATGLDWSAESAGKMTLKRSSGLQLRVGQQHTRERAQLRSRISTSSFPCQHQCCGRVAAGVVRQVL